MIRYPLISVASEIYLPGYNEKNIGGGAISNFHLFHYLSSFFDVHILTSIKHIGSKTFNSFGLTIHNHSITSVYNRGIIKDLFFRKEMSKKIQQLLFDINPKVVFAQTNSTNFTISICKRKNIKTVVLLRAFENFYYTASYMELSKKINQVFKKAFFKKYDFKAINNADLVIVNSKYMKDVVDNFFGINSFVVYPPFEIDRYKNSRKKVKNNIGFLKPETKKGLNIVIDLAKNNSDLNFLCYGSFPSGFESVFKKYPNLLYQGWKKQEEIFSNIDLLIVPSIWNEPFGRVVVEAIASGIIPITSDVGGLPEAVGNNDLTVSNPYNLKEWENKIRFFLNNKEEKEKVITNASNSIRQFDIKKQGELLKNTLLKLIE